ncbi:MAG TPA: 23S rRNA (pseudouridine(1915)-N(3))-methyltransferase RlmH [Gemmatimonadales bacterium]|jgi:23S rRNA (pseudouridine1915-N3)-methyltransferase|nr:23S rRNA (pseudouridine(1915)-N(3))-methyltransferase RlmH [Gemmatimonadales bacterium]
MRQVLVAVGKLRPAFREAADDYLRRLARSGSFAEREVREAGRAGSVTRQRDDEGQHLLAAIPEHSGVVLLDLDGERWSSEALAEQVGRWQREARDRTFVLGGAVGVSAAVRDRAECAWSLGPLTLPHELARVVVLEQLYRATTILRGEPYHKGAR